MEVGSSGRLSFGGLATGIDTGAIIDALLTIERIPLSRLEDQKKDVGTVQGLLRDLNGLLLGLRSAAQDIDNRSTTGASRAASEELLAGKATSSDESILTATARGDAALGTTPVRVERLASAARRVSAAYTSASDVVGQAGDTISISYGGTSPIELTLTGTQTLTQIRDAINASATNDGSVNASLLDDGQGGVRLVITGSEVGADDDVTVSTTATGPGGVPFVDAALSQDATNARIVVYGVAIERGSNEIDDVVPGVTLNLVGVNDPNVATDAASLTVTRDEDAVVAKLQAFVDAYNKVRDFVNKQSAATRVGEDGVRASLLSGDATLRVTTLTLQRALTNRYQFTGNPFESLAGIGIRTEEDGRLELDREAVVAALEEDAGAVAELLSGDGATNGIATELARVLEPIVRSGDGTIAERLDILDDRVDSLDGDIARFEDRLAAREETLKRRYAALERIVSTLQSASGFLDRIGR